MTPKTKKPRKEIPAWMLDYYANSAGGSVIADYQSGNVTVIKAGQK